MPITCSAEVITRASVQDKTQIEELVSVTQIDGKQIESVDKLQSDKSKLIKDDKTLATLLFSREDLPQVMENILGNNIIAKIQSDAKQKYIVFSSKDQLTQDDDNAFADIYLYYTEYQRLVLISKSTNGIKVNGASTQPKINGIGTHIVYRSEASNLDYNDLDTNQKADIYVYDIKTEQNVRVSVKEDGSQTIFPSSNPDIANNFPYVVYVKTEATQQHVYSLDIDESNTILARKQSENFNSNGELLDNSHPRISSDGRYISYFSKSKETIECTIQEIDLHTTETKFYECPRD